MISLLILTIGTAGALKVYSLYETLESTASTEQLNEHTVKPDTNNASSTIELGTASASNSQAAIQEPKTTRAFTAAPVPACTKASIIQPSGVALTQPGLNQVVETPKYYQVYGRNLDQIRSQLNTCAPNGYFASTNYRMNWSYSSKVLSNGECQLTNVRVGIHIIVQYPTWQADESTSSDTATQWNSMIRNLVIHEEGHVSRNIATANELTSALQNHPPTVCSNLAAQVQSITSQYTMKLRSSHSSYDSATNHGQTQGAWL